MKIELSRKEYIQMLGSLLDITNKEVEVLECMIDNDTTDRSVISDKLGMDIRLVSNYKVSLTKKKCLKSDVINQMFKLDKLEVYVSNKE